MKILVATNQTQGWRPTDFCWTNEDELLMPSLACDRMICGCEYSMSGMTTFKATTTFKVVESPLTKQEFIDLYLKAMSGTGFSLDDLREELIEQAVYLLEVANSFNIGEVVEYYGGQYHRRFSYPGTPVPSRILHPIEMISGSMSKCFAIALMTNTSLKQLVLSDGNFEERDIAMINTAAAPGCSVEWQKQAQSAAPTSSSTRPDLYPGELAKMMRDVNQVDLDISYHRLFHGEETILHAAFLNHRVFQRLNLNGVRLGSNVGQSLVDYLDGNSNLTKLELQNTPFPIEIMQGIIRALFINTTLTILDVSKNSLTSMIGNDIAQLLKVNTTLISLNLSNNYLNDKAMKQILIGLCFNTTLTALDISKNYPLNWPVRVSGLVNSAADAQDGPWLADDPFAPIEPFDAPVSTAAGGLVEALFDWPIGSSFDDLFGGPGDPFDDAFDPFAAPRVIVQAEPFDMGDPQLTHQKALWTPAHETMSIQMFGPHVDLTALKAFLDESRFPFMATLSGDTLLDTAAYFGEIEAMKMLIEAGHPVHVADRWGGTPLHSAAEMCQAEAVELLIQHGHPVVVDTEGGRSTALHHATIEGHVAVMEVLVRHGHPPLDLEAEEFPLLHTMIQNHRQQTTSLYELLLNRLDEDE